MMRLSRSRPMFALGLVALVGGCISLSDRPPAMLLTLGADMTPAVGQTISSASAPTIAIAPPVASAEIATTRVPVRTSGTSIAFVKGAFWSEPPPRLFARLLADVIVARTGRLVLGSAQALGDPGAKLSGDLRRFDIDEARGEAVVSYDASLRRGPNRVFEKRRFEARERVDAIDAAQIGPALNRAANRVAADVADWVGR